jgi:H/ACA ribonucleoprotein complex subunit 2
MAGNISPLDVLSHLPVMCEEANIPYVFIPTKEELGTAASTKRSTCVVMVSAKEDPEYKENYDACFEQIAALNEQMAH